MSNSVILSYDIGTSGIKTSVVSPEVAVLDSVTIPHRTFAPHPAWVEQDPMEWWDGAVRATSILLERDPSLRSRVAAIGVSGHMLSCIPVDAQGQPLYRCLIHADTRAVEQSRQVEEAIGAGAVYELTGNTLGPHASLCKILWLLQQQPDLCRKTAKFLQTKDFLVSRLTGNIDTTDLTDASHGSLIDIRRRAYDPELFRQLGIDPGLLPQLHRSTELAGTLSAESARQLGLPQGIPVSAGGGDGPCSNVGAGLSRPGDIYCCLGTTAWISYSSAEPLIDPGRRVFSILSLDGGTYGVFGTMQSAGRAVEWGIQLLGLADPNQFDQAASQAGPGSGGLVFLPYLDGERSPVFDSRARGVFFGLSPAHQREQLSRAILEGVAFALRSILDVYREQADIPAMRLVGGGAKSPLWRQIIADVLGLPIQTLTVPSQDATSLGAAIAAGVGAGIFPSVSQAVQAIAIREETPPQPGNAPAYRRCYEIYRRLYPQLKELYPMLDGLQ